MRFSGLTLVAVVGLAVSPPVSFANVVYTSLGTPLTTPSNPSGGNSDGTGVWFNPLTGYSEVRGTTFPSPLFEDGKFFLVRDTSFTTPEAEVFTQGLFSRGNTVIYASTSNLNPARFAAGASIGPGTGYQSPGTGFTDLGPTFGNWQSGGQGYLGLVIRDPAGAASSNVFYGFADITVNADFSVTLNGFAYDNIEGTPITTFTPVPEPSSLALLAGVGIVVWRRAAVAIHSGPKMSRPPISRRPRHDESTTSKFFNVMVFRTWPAFGALGRPPWCWGTGQRFLKSVFPFSRPPRDFEQN